SFLMKQPGVVFILFGGVYLLVLERKDAIDWRGLWTRIGAYGAGAALPFVLTCLILLKASVFQKFWFWTFFYAAQYASNVNFDAAGGFAVGRRCSYCANAETNYGSPIRSGTVLYFCVRLSSRAAARFPVQNGSANRLPVPLWRESFSRSSGDCRLHQSSLLAGGSGCGAWLGAGDLFLLTAAQRHGPHLHVRTHGAAEVCTANAEGNDSGN